MNDFLNNMERKYGRKAVPHLTSIMIGLIAAGYVLQVAAPKLSDYLTLNPYLILRGQIWRILTWVLIPPQGFDIFTIIMLFFYFSIGMSLERTWGDFRYNIYIFGGILISVVAAFLTYAVLPAAGGVPAMVTGAAIGAFFSTQYICTSILLAYAATFPDAVVLLMFVIPVKMKYFGFIYAAFMLYDIVQCFRAVSVRGIIYIIPVIAMAASLVNFAIFFFTSRNRVQLTPQQKKRQKEFRRQILEADSRRQAAGEGAGSGQKVVEIGPRHRCEVCGRTNLSDPDLEFRFCSKCQGAHEYCMEHLYTHIHIVPQAGPSGDSPQQEKPDVPAAPPTHEE